MGGEQPACRRFVLEVYEKTHAADESKMKGIEAASRAERIQMEAEKSALEESIKINAGIIEKLKEELSYEASRSERIELEDVKSALEETVKINAEIIKELKEELGHQIVVKHFWQNPSAVLKELRMHPEELRLRQLNLLSKRAEHSSASSGGVDLLGSEAQSSERLAELKAELVSAELHRPALQAPGY